MRLLAAPQIDQEQDPENIALLGSETKGENIVALTMKKRTMKAHTVKV